MPDLAAYEAAAVRLGQGGDELAELEARLQSNRLTCSLFDTEGYARHLERALDMMWEAAAQGAKPRSIAVPELPRRLCG